MIRISMLVVYFVSFTSACYDFSIHTRDAGSSDANVVDALGITGAEGNPPTDGTYIASGDSGNAADTRSITDGGRTTGVPGVAQPDTSETDAGGCDTASCTNGCCADSKCIPYGSQSKSRCGVEGAACGQCVAGQTCRDGMCVCTPDTCPKGCCKNNKCFLTADQSNSSCGSNGNDCGECGPGDACNKGVCSCGGNSSCPGCCSKDGECMESTNSTCGVGGGKCNTCDSKQRCSAQGACICDPTSCPTGCCDAEKKCQTPSVTACETGGRECRSCPTRTNSSAASCKSGTCVYTCDPGYSDNGTDCVNTDDCASNPCPRNAKCIDKVGGYSCDYCSTNPCKNGGTCTTASNDFSCSCKTGYSGDTCEDSKIWYKDCDGDGYAASRSGAVSAPTKPSATADCAGWVEKEPKDTASTDCDDANAQRYPGADYGLPISYTGQTLPPSGNIAYDLNCDGEQEISCGKWSVGEVKQGKLVIVPACTTSTVSCPSTSSSSWCVDSASALGTMQCGMSYGHVACRDAQGEHTAYCLCR
jgi:hypothetical protein